ncbi:MAG: porin, partial [Cyanobium sp.]
MTVSLSKLLAHLALGLLAPLAPFAAAAAELNLEGIQRYASGLTLGSQGGGLSADQVTSINQFSDVQPTEWAYQALSNLIERYGCVAGYPD